MNTPDPHAADAPEAVKPSWFAAAIIGPPIKALNPVILKLAGRKHVRMAAQIHHVGRRSGRSYVTPAQVRLTGDTFIVPLTFGNVSDWCRNVRAAGGCTIRLNGTDYRAVQPEVADRRQAAPVLRAAFTPVDRAAFRALGIRQYLLLHRADA